MKRIVPFLLIAALVAAPACGADTPAPAAATESDEFTGIGKATFGMSFDAVKKLFPKAEGLSEGQDLGSPTVGGPYIQRLVLRDQAVEGLPTPTTVELRFWKLKLWAVIVYFGDNKDQQVMDMLVKRLGKSDSTDPNNPQWMRNKTETTAAPMQRWFGVTDPALSKQAQAWFALLLTGQWKAPTDEEMVELGIPTPVPPTPAGGTPAAPPTGAAAATPAAAK